VLLQLAKGGRRSRARADLPVAGFGPVQATCCRARKTFNQWAVRRPHLTGRAKRCTGSLSTIRPVDRPELIFVVESQHCQAHEDSTQDDCLVVGRLRARRGPDGGNLSGFGSGRCASFQQAASKRAEAEGSDAGNLRPAEAARPF
jgi:hypothetical protein